MYHAFRRDRVQIICVYMHCMWDYICVYMWYIICVHIWYIIHIYTYVVSHANHVYIYGLTYIMHLDEKSDIAQLDKERERERERHTHAHTHTRTHAQTHTHTHTPASLRQLTNTVVSATHLWIQRCHVTHAHTHTHKRTHILEHMNTWRTHTHTHKRTDILSHEYLHLFGSWAILIDFMKIHTHTCTHSLSLTHTHPDTCLCSATDQFCSTILEVKIVKKAASHSIYYINRQESWLLRTWALILAQMNTFSCHLRHTYSYNDATWHTRTHKRTHILAHMNSSIYQATDQYCSTLSRHTHSLSLSLSHTHTHTHTHTHKRTPRYLPLLGNWPILLDLIKEPLWPPPQLLFWSPLSFSSALHFTPWPRKRHREGERDREKERKRNKHTHGTQTHIQTHSLTPSTCTTAHTHTHAGTRTDTHTRTHARIHTHTNA